MHTAFVYPKIKNKHNTMSLILRVFTRYIAEILLAATAINVVAYLVFAPELSHVDHYGLASDIAMAVILFFACLLIANRNSPKVGRDTLLVGFTVLYLSLLIAILGKLFMLPNVVGYFLVKLIQVIAYCFIFLGIFRWLDYTQYLERELQQLSSTDELTGLINRSSFMSAAENEVQRARRFNQELSIILIDIDHMQQINQRFDRRGGDWVLREFSGVVARKLRDYDAFCRWDGDLFFLLVPKTNEQQVLVIAEKLRASIEHTDIRLSFRLKKTLRLTASMGCATLAGTEDDFSAFLERAEQALLDAKHTGRNRVCFQPYKPNDSQISSTRALTV